MSESVMPLLTVEQVAAMLRLSTAWVRQHASGLRKPTIPSVKIGKVVRFRYQQIEEFIRAMERL
jgi:excisionase family DNA binding protein